MLITIICLFVVSSCSFSYGIKVKDCGGKNIRLHNYQIVPDKLKFGSHLNISVGVSVLRDIAGPVNLRLHMSKKVMELIK